MAALLVRTSSSGDAGTGESLPVPVYAIERRGRFFGGNQSRGWLAYLYTMLKVSKRFYHVHMEDPDLIIKGRKEEN
jgi:hypothetical protein